MLHVSCCTFVLLLWMPEEGELASKVAPCMSGLLDQVPQIEDFPENVSFHPRATLHEVCGRHCTQCRVKANSDQSWGCVRPAARGHSPLGQEHMKEEREIVR